MDLRINKSSHLSAAGMCLFLVAGGLTLLRSLGGCESNAPTVSSGDVDAGNTPGAGEVCDPVAVNTCGASRCDLGCRAGSAALVCQPQPHTGNAVGETCDGQHKCVAGAACVGGRSDGVRCRKFCRVDSDCDGLTGSSRCTEVAMTVNCGPGSAGNTVETSVCLAPDTMTPTPGSSQGGCLLAPLCGTPCMRGPGGCCPCGDPGEIVTNSHGTVRGTVEGCFTPMDAGI